MRCTSLRTVDDFTLGTNRLLLDTNTIPSAQRAALIAANIHFPSVLTPDSSFVKQFATTSSTFTRRLDPNLRIPESYQANVGFERQIGKTYAFEANYTFNRGIHLWREFNANAPRLPAGFKSFTQYLISRDFNNFPNSSGTRPIFNGTGAGALVRFQLTPLDPANPSAVGRIVEQGVPISIVNLNSFTGSNTANPLVIAAAALNSLRPNPSVTEVQQLASIGNSFYHGVQLELRRRYRRLGKTGTGFSLRAAYTLSKLLDDGIVNTSDALRVGDFTSELSRSLLDRRHRFAFSGTFDTPYVLGHLRFSPILRISTGAPFNIGNGGIDRNLDDINNDRPLYTGNLPLKFRNPGDPLDPLLLTAFSQPTIGTTGNLPRNAGMGPGQFIFDLSIEREFRITERLRLRPMVEIDNVLNKTVFTFGSEFIDFSALSPTATAQDRQDFINSFLVPTRTLRPRQVRFGIRFDF